MEKASFRIDNYKFDKVLIDYDHFDGSEIEVAFETSGIFNKTKKNYQLTLGIKCKCESQLKEFAYVRCISNFAFKNIEEELPAFFYKNSIAIIFPYIRAYLSIVSVQTNMHPVMLPTMNLSSLEGVLKSNTATIE